MTLMLDAKLLRTGRQDRGAACTGTADQPSAMTWRIPTSLKVTVPLILLGFAATLSTVNLLYHVPRAERAEEEDSRKRLAQEVSRLQSTLEYLLAQGRRVRRPARDRRARAQPRRHPGGDDRRPQTVIAATRRAWLGRKIADVLPQFDLDQAAEAIRQRRAGLTVSDAATSCWATRAS